MDAEAEAEFEAQLAAVLAESQETARLERQSRRIDPSDDRTLEELGNAKLLRELAFDAPGDKVAYLPTAAGGGVAAAAAVGPGSSRKKRPAAAATAAAPPAVVADENESSDEDNREDDEPLVSAMYEPGSTQHTEAIARAGSQSSPEIMKKVREAAVAAAAEANSASGNPASELAPEVSPPKSQDLTAEEGEDEDTDADADEDTVSGANEHQAMMSPEFQGSEAANSERSVGRQGRARKPSKEVEQLMAMGFDRQNCEDALRKGRQPHPQRPLSLPHAWQSDTATVPGCSPSLPVPLCFCLPHSHAPLLLPVFICCRKR